MNEIVSCTPQALDDYLHETEAHFSSVRRRLADIEEAISRFNCSLDHQVNPIHTKLDLAGLERSRRLDESIAVVAQRFRMTSEGSKLTTLAQTLGNPLALTFDTERRKALLQEARDELAHLAEFNSRSGPDSDPTYRVELAAYLNLMRHEVESAAVGLSGDSAARAMHQSASKLFEHLGGGDLSDALNMLSEQIRQGPGHAQRGTASAADLAFVASWALEGDEDRAERWVATIVSRAGTDDDTAPYGLLGILSLNCARSTTTLAEAAFWATSDQSGKLAKDLLGWNKSSALDTGYGTMTPVDAQLKALSTHPLLANKVLTEGFSLARSARSRRGFTATINGWNSVVGNGGVQPNYSPGLGAALEAGLSSKLDNAARTRLAIALIEWGSTTQIGAANAPDSKLIKTAIGSTVDLVIRQLYISGGNELHRPGSSQIIVGFTQSFNKFLDRYRDDDAIAQALTHTITSMTGRQVFLVSSNEISEGRLSALGRTLQFLAASQGRNRLVSISATARADGGPSALLAFLGSVPISMPPVGLGVAVLEAASLYYGNPPRASGTGLVPAEFSAFVKVQMFLGYLSSHHSLAPQLAVDAVAAAMSSGGYQAARNTIESRADLEAVEREVERLTERIDPDLLDTLDAIFST